MNSSTNQPIKIYEDQIRDFKSEDLAAYFSCLICMGIAIDPLKCNGCNQVYCRTCLPKDVFDKSTKVKYPNKPYQCYKLCG